MMLVQLLRHNCTCGFVNVCALHCTFKLLSLPGMQVIKMSQLSDTYDSGSFYVEIELPLVTF